MKINKERLDSVLVKQGYFETIDAAKRAVMAGIVYSNEERLDKPGDKVKINEPITIKGKQSRYVSRGGLKLEKALAKFSINVVDKIVIDIGASTGGFTDCALQHGAKMSYAVDVGYNQLAWKLRQDSRVVVMERTNFRYLTSADLKQAQPNFATIDVSFISLQLILPVLKKLLVPKSDCIALIKPQFEARRDEVGDRGIVRDKSVHQKVIANMVAFSIVEGYDVKDISFSPITGSNGNIEFLLHLCWTGKNEAGINHVRTDLTEIVDEAHRHLKEKH